MEKLGYFWIQQKFVRLINEWFFISLWNMLEMPTEMKLIISHHLVSIMNKTRKSSCVNARGILPSAYQVLSLFCSVLVGDTTVLTGGYPSPGQGGTQWQGPNAWHVVPLPYPGQGYPWLGLVYCFLGVRYSYLGLRYLPTWDWGTSSPGTGVPLTWDWGTPCLVLGYPSPEGTLDQSLGYPCWKDVGPVEV